MTPSELIEEDLERIGLSFPPCDYLQHENMVGYGEFIIIPIPPFTGPENDRKPKEIRVYTPSGVFIGVYESTQTFRDTLVTIR